MALNRRVREILDLELSLPRQQLPVRQAYSDVLRWKGAVQARQIRQRQLLDPADAPLAEELQSTITRLTVLSLNVPDGNLRKPWLAQVDLLKQRKETLEAELAQRSQSFKTQQEATAITPEQLQSVLPSDTALVDVLEYVQFSGGHSKSDPDETHYVAFVVRNDRPVKRIDLGPVEPIDEAIETCRTDSLFQAEQSAAEPLRELSKRIWEPIAPYVMGCHTILYSPDGNLTRFPLSALPGDARGRYLIEDFAIGIVPVPRMLPEMLKVPASEHVRQLAPNADMLLVGNIDYDAAPGQDDESNHNQLSKEAAGGELLTFERLKSAPEEIGWFESQFHRRFPAGTLRTLQLSQATEAEFRREAPRHRWLFIATHGFFAPPNITAALATQDELVGLDPADLRTPAPEAVPCAD